MLATQFLRAAAGRGLGGIEMNAKQERRGPWTHRVLVYLLTGLLGVLFYWLFGFIINDIGTWPGPDYAAIEERMLDPQLRKRESELREQISQTTRSIEEQQSRQRVLSDSTEASQRTMNQLLQFQRLNLEKGVTPSDEEQKALADSQQLFLANQRQYQLLNEEIARLNDRLRDLQKQEREHEAVLADARKPVQEAYNAQWERHRLKIGALKLAVLLPLLAVGVVLFLKMRSSTYAPLVYAFGLAVLLEVGLVMHEYFPSRYFKYILILAALLVVFKSLVALLRMVAFPKKDWLLKQYREAYERFLCPICEFPIRRGPLKYVFWSRRSLKHIALPHTPENGVPDSAYTCPMCATRLFEECAKCHAVRHSLLPACESCGYERPIPGPEAAAVPAGRAGG
jgi:hypothetical protein